ncbi:hypothetical protein ACFX2A_015487 [Malus domestica]
MNTLKVESLLGMFTIRLQDDNFVKWSFQFRSVLEGYDLFDHFDGTSVCPPKFVFTEANGITTEITAAYKEWIKQDRALVSLLLATLGDEAVEYVVGCKTAHEAWMNLQDRYATVSRARVNHLKTELLTIKKGSDSVEKYMLRLKALKDQLLAAGEVVSENDLIVAALAGLPAEFNMIRTVIVARETPISLKEFRAQLLAAERTADDSQSTLHFPMSAMYCQGESSNAHSSQDQGASQYFSGGSGFVTEATNSSQSTAHRPTGGIVSQASLPHFHQQGNGNFQNHRGYQHNGGNNGRFNNRSRYNGNNNGRFSGNSNGFPGGSNSNGFSGSSKGGSNWQNWNGNSGFKPTLIPECQICHKRGHTATNCYSRYDASSSSAPPILECQICGKKGHSALNCYHRGNYAYQGAQPPSSFNAFTAQAHPNLLSSSQQNWVLDTGATHHMTADLDHLTLITPFEGTDRITVGNGEGLPVANTGSGSLLTSSKPLTLQMVLHVPQLAASLLSVYRLCKDNHCYVILDEFGFWVQDKATKKVLLRGRSSSSGLYYIPQQQFFNYSQLVNNTPQALLGQLVKTSIWHQRLGHPTNEVQLKMLKESQISVSLDNSPQLCSACIRGKMTRQPFHSHCNKSSVPFEKVHTDVWGPSPTVSLEGYKYYVIFVDECTRFTWIFPLVNKSDVYPVFVKFHAFVINHFKCNIKTLQSDGGGEYMSRLFKQFLDTNGILHLVSCPYTPQQNGLAERKHRHIIETTVTLLSAAGLPQQFWFHACSHAVFLINRMPCQNLEMVSPYVKLFAQSPSLSSLKIFGTAVYPYLRPYNVNKLQARSDECVFLGYSIGYKGVLCYNRNTQRLLLSRHVIHDENVFPFKKSHSSVHISSPVVSSQQELPRMRYIVVPNSSTPTREEIGGNDQSVDMHSMASQSSSLSSSPVLHSSSDIQATTLHPSPSSSQVLPVLDLDQNQVSSSPVIHTSSEHNMVTRLKSGVLQRKDYSAYYASASNTSVDNDVMFCGFTAILDIHDSLEPSHYKQAVLSEDWRNAMKEEFVSLQKQGTWELVPPPVDRNVIGSKWVYKIKKDQDGKVSRYKARLVTQGYSQEQGLDYDETFSPVVRHTTVRLVLSLAAMQGWELRHLDVKNAFLHGELQEEVFMKQPQGFQDPQHPNHVCKLLKSLYGLKQAPRAWNAKFTSYLPSLDFQSSHSDPSLFVKVCGNDVVILLLYVDDIIITGSSSFLIQQVIAELSSAFDMKDMGKLTYFLGLQITYKDNGDIFINQSKYVTDLLHKAGMINCRPCSTPSKPHTQLLKDEGEPLADPTVYRSLVGALQYLTFTRPDIAYAVNYACQFMTTPTEAHFCLVKRILRYLKGTWQCGLTYSAQANMDLLAYSDADWAAYINTRRSTTGYIVFLGSNPVSWQSKKQGSVSRSSTEAEYKALANAAADVAWIRLVLKDLHMFLPSVPLVHCDNLSTLALCSNPVFHTRIKHLDTDFHFVRERVQKGDLQVQYIPTEAQIADVLTKGLHSPLFVHHCSNLRLGYPS